MNPRLQKIQDILRQLHLLHATEQVRYTFRRLMLQQKNSAFKRANPNFSLPPANLAFDAYGTVDWEFYEQSGKALANRIAKEIFKHNGPKISSVFEWGCGPARVIRHLPACMPDTKIFGSDYNPQTIAWCQTHIPEITFLKNNLNPPLSFQDSFFDSIYAISVFTHLSESVCLSWISELNRVLARDGTIMIWTNGDYIANFLLREEREAYNEARFIVRDKYAEGKKMYLSFHPPTWVRNTLLKDFDVLKHYSGGFSGMEQDIWIAKSRKM